MAATSPEDSPLRLVHDGSPSYVEDWAREMERGRWPGWICDGELTLRYASTELKTFMGQSLGREIDDAAAGVGQGILEALTNEAWTATMSADSLGELMPRVMAYLKDEFAEDPDSGVRCPSPSSPSSKPPPRSAPTACSRTGSNTRFRTCRRSRSSSC